jgi:hypothetical protein
MPSVQGSPGAGSASGPSVGLPGFEQSSPGVAAASNFMGMALQAAQIKDVNASADLKGAQVTTETTKQALNTATVALNGSLKLSAEARAALDNINTSIIDATSASSIALARQNVANAEAQFKKFLSDANLNDALRAQSGFTSHQISVNTQLIAAQIGVAKAVEYATRAKGDLDRSNIPLIQQLVLNAVTDGTIKDFAAKDARVRFEGYKDETTPRIMPYWMSEMRIGHVAADLGRTKNIAEIVGNGVQGGMNLALMFLLLRSGRAPKSVKGFAGFR